MVKSEFLCIPAQLVYGTILRLPGQFITPASSNELDPTVYADRFQNAMQTLTPVLPCPQLIKSFVPKDLSSCTHVYVRTKAVRKPLQPAYMGPFKVLHPHDNYFTLDVHSRKNNISIDRRKVVYLDADLLPPFQPDTILSRTTAPIAPEPAQTTRSGRKVHFPDGLEY